MLFWDVVHQTIDLRAANLDGLLAALISTPELQRLRHMRLMNFDVPQIQDLATAKRFPHSIGTCYLASWVGQRSNLSPYEFRVFVTAALIHDVGILPFGHLVETVLRRNNPGFSHEELVKDILFGTYHPTNIYHQIQTGRSLHLASVLREYGIDPTDVLALIHPKEKSAIAADIDLDNIDNIHRMAAFLGYPGVRANVEMILRGAFIKKQYQLVFSGEALGAIGFWHNLRESIYTRIIAHPECVSYNAWLRDLVECAVQNRLIDKTNWFINEQDFEYVLLEDPKTRNLAEQLETGCAYRLLDYVWFYSTGTPPVTPWSTVEKSLANSLPPPVNGAQYFLWAENGLISRAVRVSIDDCRECKSLGSDSVSFLVALVYKRTKGNFRSPQNTEPQKAWRKMVVEAARSEFGEWEFRLMFPETYEDEELKWADKTKQLALF